MPEIIEEPQDGYDWDLWTDGKSRKFVKGVDYASDSFKTYVHAVAKRKGLTVRTKSVEDGVIVTFGGHANDSSS